MYSLKHCGNFVTFFCFLYFIYSRRGLYAGSRANFYHFCFFSFSFFSFFGTQTSLSISETCDGSDLSYSLFCPVYIAKKHVARQGRFVYSGTWTFFFFFRCFRVGISPYFFRITVLALAKVIRLLLALQREMCFTQNIRSRVTWKRKEK